MLRKDAENRPKVGARRAAAAAHGVVGRAAELVAVVVLDPVCQAAVRPAAAGGAAADRGPIYRQQTYIQAITIQAITIYAITISVLLQIAGLYIGSRPYRAITIQDHNYAGHNYISHNYTGHNYTGHNYICHNYIGAAADRGHRAALRPLAHALPVDELGRRAQRGAAAHLPAAK